MKTAQLYESRGYHCIDLRQGYAKFFNEDDTISVTYDILSVPKFFKLISGYEANQKNLRFRFSVNTGPWNPVRPSQLKTCPALAEETLFYEQAEYETLIRHANEEIFTKVLPILEEIAANPTLVRAEYHTMLAEKPEAKAAAFSKKYGREIRWDPETRAWCKAWLSERIPSQATERPAAFERDIQEYIEFIAFCGELRRLERDRTWKWSNFHGEDDPRFVLKNNSAPENSAGIDVIVNVVDYWNLSSNIECELFPL